MTRVCEHCQALRFPKEPRPQRTAVTMGRSACQPGRTVCRGGTRTRHRSHHGVNEGMTGVFTQNPAFSRMTLAALEDTGWYMVNYAYAMPFRFGQGLGCDFTDNSCYGWWNGRSSPLPYCTVQPPAGSTGRTDCTPDYFSVGSCNLITHNADIPEQYRYFSSNRQGGQIESSDFCPFYKEITFTGGRRTGCALAANQPTSMGSNLNAETYGNTSRCFRHGTTQGWTVNGQSFTGGSGCYKYTCSPSSGVTLFVLGQEFACDFEGKEISIDITSEGFSYRGSLICPSCQDLCWDNTALCPTGSTSVSTGAGPNTATAATSTPAPASSPPVATASSPPAATQQPTSAALSVVHSGSALVLGLLAATVLAFWMA